MDARASFGDGFPPGVHRIGGVAIWGLERGIAVIGVAVVIGGGGRGSGGTTVDVEVHGGGVEEIGKAPPLRWNFVRLRLISSQYSQEWGKGSLI